MTFTDFITNHGKRINKEAFIHLVQISRIDGKMEKQEMELLHKEGRKFGLTEPEIDHLISSERDHNFHPPYSLEDKFEHLYNIAQIILADEDVQESEGRMIRRFAIESGFDYSRIDNLISTLIEGIRANESEERIFRKFRKVLRG